jgi:hypothetical protein
MFRTVPLFIIRSPLLYTQQYVYVKQVMLTACYQEYERKKNRLQGRHLLHLSAA